MPREPVESTVSLHFRTTPDRAAALKERARRSHRSIAGELALILEQALDGAAHDAKAA